MREVPLFALIRSYYVQTMGSDFTWTVLVMYTGSDSNQTPCGVPEMWHVHFSPKNNQQKIIFLISFQSINQCFDLKSFLDEWTYQELW